MKQELLEKICQAHIDSSFPLHSRVHKMQSLDLYVKREDELGFGISGSKLRKYVSILPVLKQEQKTVAVVGSPYSNHVLSIVQLLKQEGLSYLLFLEKPHSPIKELKGNFFYLSLLVKQEEIFWVDSIPDPWTFTWGLDLEKELEKEFFWIPPGGAMKEALPGSLTLCLDLIENEKKLDFTFDHVFVDAGTGMMASSLILALSYLQKKTKIHVVLIAGTEASFLSQLDKMKGYIEELLGEKVNPCNYELLFPTVSKSFGSCNATLFKWIQEIAQKEGVFLDPIYTAKLLLAAKEKIKKEVLNGRILWIHSGGALSLSGFQGYFESK